MLGVFAELALSLARDLHDAAIAAEAPEDKARLADGFHRMGRGLRQTLALHERLQRNGERAAREDAGFAVQQGKARRDRRKAQVNAAIARDVWSEYEPEEAEAIEILERLDKVLDAEVELDGFEDEAIAAQIARICRLIGYQPPALLDVEAGPPAPGPDAGPAVHSSA